MGSFKINTRWQNKWKIIKPTLTINSRQYSLIIGSMLGDGTLRVGSGAINANLKIEQGLVQKDYVFIVEVSNTAFACFYRTKDKLPISRK